MTTIAKRALFCRACGSASLRTFFSLDRQPLANNFLATPNDADPFFPLALQRCQSCTLIQLTHVVPPEVLYSGYRFASGVSGGWHDHCVALLDGRRPGRLLDIASNDGTLVKAALEMGWDAVGVDPEPLGSYPVLQGYWPAVPVESAAYDLITAQNVFGHVDLVFDFLVAARDALALGGRLLIECPDTLLTLEEAHYDQVYHEHLSYWTLLPLWLLARRASLDVVHIESLPLHGGSLRYWLAHQGDPTTPSSTVTKRLQEEQRLRKPALTRHFTVTANAHITSCVNTLRQLGREGQKVYVCGASAKSTVVLNALAAKGAPLPDAILDDSPLKQGRFSPGLGLPVVPFDDLSSVNVILLTAWNWAAPMMQRCREHGFQGRFLLPHD